jgi:cystinosin
LTGIWQIILDFSGGVLSDLQLVGDCYVLEEWSGITGNLAKLLLGFVSITFDTIFMLQHYVWYADRDTEGIAEGAHVREDDMVGLLL